MYQRQVSSSPRSVLGDHLLERRAAGRPVEDQVVDERARRGCSVRAAHERVRTRSVSRPSSIQAVGRHRLRRCRTPTAAAPSDAVDDLERRALQAGRGRVGAQRAAAAARAARRSGCRRRRRRRRCGPPRRRGPRPSSRRRSSGRRRRSAAGSSRTARPAGRSGCRAQSSRCSSPAATASTSTSVKSRVCSAGPGRAGEVGGLAVDLEAAVGLVEAAAQAGRRAEEVRRHLVLGEAVQQPVARRASDANTAPSAGAKSSNTSTLGVGRPRPTQSSSCG